MTIENLGEGMTSQPHTTMKKDRRVYTSGGAYDGEWKVGASKVIVCREGTGRLELPDKSVYRGQFEGGQCQGLGVMDVSADATNNA